MKTKLLMLFIIFSSLLYDEDTAKVPVDENINSEIVGRLSKLSEITLYEESTHEDTIDNFKSPWYKTKTADGKDG